MKTTIKVVIIAIITVSAAKEYAYNIDNDIHCITKNHISTEEACKRWRDNMKKIGYGNIFCKQIVSKDEKEQRACSPTFIVNNDIITKLSYKWKPSDTDRPFTVEVEYTGLSRKEIHTLVIIYGTCIIGIISCLCTNGCPDCSDTSCNDDNFLTGVIIGNLLSDNDNWGNNNYCNSDFSLATIED